MPAYTCPPCAAMFVSSAVFTLYSTGMFIKDLRQHLKVGWWVDGQWLGWGGGQEADGRASRGAR